MPERPKGLGRGLSGFGRAAGGPQEAPRGPRRHQEAESNVFLRVPRSYDLHRRGTESPNSGWGVGGGAYKHQRCLDLRFEEAKDEGRSAWDLSTRRRVRRILFLKVPLEDITLVSLQNCLPDGCEVSFDNSTSDLRVTYSNYGLSKQFTRSVPYYGHTEAARRLVSAVWRWVIDLGFELECPFAELKLS